MRIIILTFGSRGDVQPYLALGRGLRRAGHQVALAGHAQFSGLANEAGLDFRPLPGDPRRMLQSPAGQAWVRSGEDGYQFLTNFVKLTRPLLPDLLRASEQLVQEADLIVFSQLSFSGYHLAEARRIPALMASLQPFSPTRQFPAVGAVGPSIPGLWNLVSHHVTEYLLWLPFRDIINRWRSESLGLAPNRLIPPSRIAHRRGLPIGYGFSPTVVPRPDDWDDHIRITGYWFLDGDEEWRPSPELLEFLSGAEPVVYVGFGSMIRGESSHLQRIVQRVAERLNCRVVLQRGWEQMEDAPPHSHVLVVGSLPHSWLFPRMRVLVHHGGAGTTGAGLRAGVPSVLVPHFADQFFWSKRVSELGAGPEYVTRNDLDVERLERALASALEQPALAERAHELGNRIQAESGVQRGVRLVEAAREFSW